MFRINPYSYKKGMLHLYYVCMYNSAESPEVLQIIPLPLLMIARSG